MYRKPDNDASRMADKESEMSLLTSLKADFPSIPLPVMLKVMNKCHKDQEKCRQLLELEKANYPGNSESLPSSQASGGYNNDATSVSTRIKELTVSHEPSSSRPIPPERHVSIIERSLPGRPSEPKKNVIGPSISLTVQTPDRQPPPASQSQTNRTQTVGLSTPQTAPADLSSFFGDSTSPTNIPNITCKAYSGSGQPAVPSRSRQISVPLDSSNSPKERRLVKVITIPPGSSSGGSVSSAGMSSNPRHFRMHFGDTGGTCTVQSNQPNIQRHESAPNINQHYRSEIRTETSAPHAVHSSSIVVNTSPHGNHSTPERSVSGGSSEFPQTSNPFQFVPSSATHEFQPNSSTSAHTTAAGKPLSTPVQASSPGVSHSRPVFVEIKQDPPHGYSDPRYPATSYNFPHSSMENIPVSVAALPYGSYPSYELPGNMNYRSEVASDFSNHRAGYGLHPSHSITDHQNLAHLTQPQQQQQHPGYPNPPSSLYRPPSNTAYNPSYPPFNTPSTMSYPIMPSGAISRPGLGSNPSQQNHFNHYSHFSPHLITGPPMSHGHIGGATQPRFPIRTNSQDSDQNLPVGIPTDYDPRINHYPGSGSSRVSSQGSVSSDTSLRGEGLERPHSGSIQEDLDDEYIRTLLQHQRSRMQKMREDTDSQTQLLTELRNEVSQLEKSMTERRKGKWALPSFEDLRESNRQLQTDIQIFINELDMYKNGQTPFNQINAMEQQSFFDNMPTGQQDPTYVRSPDGSASPKRPTVPPRPPPPIPVRHRNVDPKPISGRNLSGSDLFQRVPPVPSHQPTISSGDSEEGEHWSCSACTFSNHPALKKCEMCEMPRVVAPCPVPSLGTGTPQHSTTLPHHLAPGLVSHVHQRSGSPAPSFGQSHHHHRAGT